MATASSELLGNKFRLLGERVVFPFGSWWEAEDEEGARALVLRLHAQVSDPAAAVKRAIERAAKINSPHVVPWVDGGLDAAGQGWLAAPMLGPWTFAEHVTRTEGIEPAESGVLLHQVARGMAAAEAAGIAHHALNSEFVRVVPLADGTNSIKLYGYGLADVLPPHKPLRKQDAYVGVPDYMSPEMCGGKAVDGSSADVYAVGILMYEAVRGRPPFAPTFASASASTTLKRHIFEKPLPLNVRYASTRFIKPYEAISFKALNKTANRRHATLAELEQELASFVTADMQLQLVPLEAVGARIPQTARRSRTQLLEAIGGPVGVALTGAQPIESEQTAAVEAEISAADLAEAEIAAEAELAAARKDQDRTVATGAASFGDLASAADEDDDATIVISAESILDAGAERSDEDEDSDDEDSEDEEGEPEPEDHYARTQMFRGIAAPGDTSSGDDSGDEEGLEADTQSRATGGSRGGKGKKGRNKSTRKSRRPTIDAHASVVVSSAVEIVPAERHRAAAAPTVVMAAASKAAPAAAAVVDSGLGAAERPRVSGKLGQRSEDGKARGASDEPKKASIADEQDAWFDADAAPAQKKKSPLIFILLLLLAVAAVVIVVVVATSGPQGQAPAAPADEGPKYGSTTSSSPTGAAPAATVAAADGNAAGVNGADPEAAAVDPVVAAEPVVAPVAKPEPVVAAKPEPTVAAKPEPTVTVKPEPAVAVKPDPKPTPVVAAKPDPTPTPVVAAKPDPKPTPVVAPKPASADSPEAQFKKDAARYMELGLAAYKKDNYKLAAGYFSKALDADPSHALASRYLKQAKDKLAN